MSLDIVFPSRFQKNRLFVYCIDYFSLIDIMKLIMSTLLEKTQVIVKNGKPRAVILDIKKYESLLEMAEDREDLAELRRIKKGKIAFRILDDYLKIRV